jgi:thiol-disulfide isomerase/thioredoxin
LFGLGPRHGWQDNYQLEVSWPSGLVERVEARPGDSLDLIEGRATVERIVEKRVTLPDPENTSDRILRTLAFKQGEKIPALALDALPSSSSMSLSLASLLEPGRKTLINLWATWCAPCAVEMPELARIYEPLSGAGVDLIGVSLDFGQAEKVETFLKERSIPYRNFLLSEDAVSKVFASGQITVPLSLLLDEDGRVVQAFSGWSAETRAGIEALLTNN